MSSSSREDSPDWLRSYQAPNQSIVTLSSGSLSPLSDDEDEIKLNKLFKKEVSPEKMKGDQDEEVSQVNKTSKAKSPAKNRRPVSPEMIESDQEEEEEKTFKPKSPVKNQKADQTQGRKRKRELPRGKEGKRARGQAVETKTSGKLASPEPNLSVWALSSDSDSCPDSKPVRMDIDPDKRFPASDKTQYGETEKDELAIPDDGGEPPVEVSTMKTPKKQLRKEKKPSKVEETGNALKNGGNSGEMDVEEDILVKRNGPNVSSRLPLVLSEKVQRSKALLECEGDSIDLSGDVGAVGRVVISDNSENHEMLLDLKGTVYRTSIVPSRTFCVVSFGQSEAKVEAIMNDFIQLRPQSNVYDAETMVEGTLEGFSFDSEDDVDDLPKTTVPTNQNEDAEERPNGKTKQGSQRASGAAGKKVKTAGGKPAKKVRKKSQAPKKGKTKK